MENTFKDEIAFVSNSNKCSPLIKAIVRKDESAAITLPKYKKEMMQAYKLRHYLKTDEIREYIIEDIYVDTERPLTKWLVKPIVIKLAKRVA